MAIELNLIPAPLLEAQSKRRHLRVWGASLFPALCLLVIIACLNWFRQAQAAESAAAAEALTSQLEQARAEVRRLTAAVTERSLQLKRAEALHSKRSWSGMMGLLAKARPDDVWFSTVATDPAAPLGAKAAATGRGSGPGKDAAAKPVTVEAPRKLLVSGHSLSATGPLTLVSNLKKENVFSRVALERSLRDADQHQSRFQFDVVIEW